MGKFDTNILTTLAGEHRVFHLVFPTVYQCIQVMYKLYMTEKVLIEQFLLLFKYGTYRILLKLWFLTSQCLIEPCTICYSSFSKHFQF
jgi:hypothetical protein